MIQAGDGLCGGAGSVRANVSHVAILHFVLRDWERGNVGDVVRTGIVAIENIEELDEGCHRPALADREWTADAQVRLNIWRAAQRIEADGRAIDDGAIVHVISEAGYRDAGR